MFAQSNLPACQGRDTAKWSNCFGIEAYPSGSKYAGEFINGKPHGLGAFHSSNGTISEGVWADGKFIRSAPEQQVSVNNQTVTGASIQLNNSSSNLPTCRGRDDSLWTNCLGDRYGYVGEYQQGKRTGWGTLTFTDGRKYVGEFYVGAFQGEGTLFSANGTVVNSGIWIWNVFQGEGRKQKNNIEESMRSSLPKCPASGTNDNCFGTETYGSGNKYVGEFKDGSYHGKGVLLSVKGEIIKSGLWIDGELKEQQNNLVSISPNTLDNSKLERDRLSAEVDTERRKRQELEEQLRVAQLSTQPNKPILTSGIERRVALVIGNASYKVNPLKNPVNDSTDMARSLRSVGFDVIEANNTTLAQMREVTRRFADKLGNSEVGLVYYSGHGVEVKGKNYLIPVNADIKREYEVVDQAFDASQFLEMMDNIRGPNNKRVNILIVDACRNNELQKSWRSTNNGLARMDAPGGTFISFATAPGRVAADGTGRNSPYTKHLLQALKQPNVPIEQVFKVVRRNVMEETKGEQIPWENSSLVGDFYFTVQR